MPLSEGPNSGVSTRALVTRAGPKSGVSPRALVEQRVSCVSFVPQAMPPLQTDLPAGQRSSLESAVLERTKQLNRLFEDQVRPYLPPSPTFHALLPPSMAF